MRRFLRKIAEDDFSNLGGTPRPSPSPRWVGDLVNNRQNRRAGTHA
jgi:hypothetical protein